MVSMTVFRQLFTALIDLSVLISINLQTDKAIKQMSRWALILGSLKWNIGRIFKSDLETRKGLLDMPEVFILYDDFLVCLVF